jgi:hypothetical protein
LYSKKKMHPQLPTLILAHAILLPAATQAFQLTNPTTASKLDLTNPITISWDATEGTFSEPAARALDLWFHVVFGGDGNNGDRAGWEIASNLSLAASRDSYYEWDPSGIAKLIQDNSYTLSPDAVHTFEARLLDQDGEGLARVESDGYALEGVDFVSDGGGSSDGARAAVYGATVAAAAVGIMAVLF